MTNASYLWAVARALQREVRPFMDNSEGRAALDNSIRVLTATANALEPGPDVFPVTLDDDLTLADTDRLEGPAENAAAYRRTGAIIAETAARLNGEGNIEKFADAIAGERTLLEAAIGRMNEVEHAPPRGSSDDGGSIDPQRLTAYLRARTGCDSLEIATFRLIVGGRSRQTALVSLTNMGDLPPKFVIQRGLPGLAPGAAFLGEDTQFSLLDRLYRAGMRVPRPILVETDPSWLEAPFLLVEQLAGATAQPDYWRAAEDERVVLDLARQMAILHAQPVNETGQGLRQSRDRFDIEGWKAELEEMAREWNERAHWPSVTMSAVIAWLRNNVDCLDDRRAIVHNDMLFHNILAEDGKITGVLDWEQCAIGHPGEDLGYCYPAVIASTDWPSFFDAYRAAGGADIPQRQIHYFALRGGLRLMNLVLKGGRDTFEQGLSDDVLVASAGAHFTQRLLHRIALVLKSVLEGQ